ncbi:MAG: calcium/sodium antiporter [Deltaproteobacteria bacterium]|nr:calcium/sodium antiporter [Deltaproteobacteria bacterium]
MDIAAILFFFIGLGLLIAGAEALVRGASRLATFMGVSHLVIGLTVVSFGTSAPEMAVSVLSGLSGKADIAVGNVVGSNILNVLLILGLSAAIAPLFVSRQLIRLDVPIMICVSVLTLVFGANGRISRVEGFILFGGILAYMAFSIRKSRKEDNGRQEGEIEHQPGREQQPGRYLLVNITLILGGLVSLVLGSRWLVNGATAIATSLGVSELVIGLTIVAAGTSLPEVATSLVAAIRGERDIAVGNVVGSNIFNILAALGLTGIVAPDGIVVSSQAIRFDIPVMIAVAVACLPIFFSGYIISRWEGLLFLAYYVAYTAFLILKSTHHATLPIFSKVMVAFVIPITVVTLVTTTIRFIRSGRHKNGEGG